MPRAAPTSGVLRALDALVRLLARTGISEHFIRFGIVGGLGFVWDTATVYLTRGLIGLYAAGALSYLVAATANWALNRAWTFRASTPQAAHRQWVAFLAANSLGFVLNRGCFYLLISTSRLCFAHPVLPIIAGSLCGMFVNYLLSKRFVFR
jgi:putative flippase GtrA